MRSYMPGARPVISVVPVPPIVVIGKLVTPEPVNVKGKSKVALEPVPSVFLTIINLPLGTGAQPSAVAVLAIVVNAPKFRKPVKNGSPVPRSQSRESTLVVSGLGRL